MVEYKLSQSADDGQLVFHEMTWMLIIDPETFRESSSNESDFCAMCSKNNPNKSSNGIYMRNILYVCKYFP
jgi:hypothetical protein